MCEFCGVVFKEKRPILCIDLADKVWTSSVTETIVTSLKETRRKIRPQGGHDGFQRMDVEEATKPKGAEGEPQEPKATRSKEIVKKEEAQAQKDQEEAGKQGQGKRRGDGHADSQYDKPYWEAGVTWDVVDCGCTGNCGWHAPSYGIRAGLEQSDHTETESMLGNIRAATRKRQNHEVWQNNWTRRCTRIGRRKVESPRRRWRNSSKCCREEITGSVRSMLVRVNTSPFVTSLPSTSMKWITGKRLQTSWRQMRRQGRSGSLYCWYGIEITTRGKYAHYPGPIIHEPVEEGLGGYHAPHATTLA